MNRFIRTLALVMFLSICNLAPMPALATTYDISFLGEGGSTLTGSITTSVTSGAVVQSDIVAWSFSSSLGGGFVLSSTDPGSIFFQSPSELTVSGTSLLFAPSPGVSTFNRFSSGLSSVVFQAAQGRGGMCFRLRSFGAHNRASWIRYPSVTLFGVSLRSWLESLVPRPPFPSLRQYS